MVYTVYIRCASDNKIQLCEFRGQKRLSENNLHNLVDSVKGASAWKEQNGDFSHRLGVRVDFSQMVTERGTSFPREQNYKSKGLG